VNCESVAKMACKSGVEAGWSPFILRRLRYSCWWHMLVFYRGYQTSDRRKRIHVGM